MTAGLGIDAGGTATRWHVADAAGAKLASGQAPPMSGHLFSDAARQHARAVIDAIAEAAARTVAVTGIVAGVTGLTRGSAGAQLVGDMLAARFTLPASRILVEEDLWVAYRCCFEPGQGILLYSGTGSIGYHVTATSEVVRVGGRGALIDDAGSAFWIAREALRGTLRADEERPGSGWSTKLGRALAAAIGGTEWDAVRTFVYGGARGDMASLARAVATAAVEGDETALGILREAGREIARLGNVLIGRVGVLPVAVTGGALRLHPAMLKSLCAALPAEARPKVVDIDSAAAAALIATRF